MARSAGVEPATARFVAEYSIQLSYERIDYLINYCACCKAHNYRHIYSKGQAISIYFCNKSTSLSRPTILEPFINTVAPK